MAKLIGKGTIKSCLFPDTWFMSAKRSDNIASISNESLNINVVNESQFTCFYNDSGNIPFVDDSLIQYSYADAYSLSNSPSVNGLRGKYVIVIANNKFDAFTARANGSHFPESYREITVGNASLWNKNPFIPSESVGRDVETKQFVENAVEDSVNRLMKKSLVAIANPLQYAFPTEVSGAVLSSRLGFDVQEMGPGTVVLRKLSYKSERTLSNINPSPKVKLGSRDLIYATVEETTTNHKNHVFSQMPASISGGNPIVESTNCFVYFKDGVYTVTAFELMADKDGNVTYSDLDVDAILNEKNSELVKTAKARREGADVKVDRTKPIFPDDISPHVRQNIDGWWVQFQAAADAVDNVPLGDGAFANWSLNNADKTSEDFKDQMVATETAGTSSWSNLWSAFKDGSSAVWDTISEWGPLQIAGGYAAVKATNKAAKVSPTLLVGAAAIVAVLVLRD